MHDVAAYCGAGPVDARTMSSTIDLCESLGERRRARHHVQRALAGSMRGARASARCTRSAAMAIPASISYARAIKASASEAPSPKPAKGDHAWFGISIDLEALISSHGAAGRLLISGTPN